MNIAVDIGNSRIKVGLFEKQELQKVECYTSLKELKLTPSESNFYVFSSVKGKPWVDSLGLKSYLDVSYKTSMPIKLNYKTPDTLGVDRITAAVGAQAIFPKKNVLIIDFGTCITIDILSDSGVFHGGIISPGLQMRQKAMHQQTAQLPNISQTWQNYDCALPGKSTLECLFHGSFTSICMEINGYIEHFKKDYDQLDVLITGGNAHHFESKLKAPIFADPNLVLKGLNKILTYNKFND